MATENPVLIKGFQAAADLSTKQYYIVGLSGTDLVDVRTTATQRPVGVLQNKPSVNQTADVMLFGISKFSADAAVAVDDYVKSSADGQGAKAVSGTDSGLWYIGHCIEVTSAAGDFGSMMIAGAKKI